MLAELVDTRRLDSLMTYMFPGAPGLVEGWPLEPDPRRQQSTAAGAPWARSIGTCVHCDARRVESGPWTKGSLATRLA